MSMLAKTAVLLLPLVLMLAGCVEEDAITITGDGLVTFQSVVTLSDDKKTKLADIEKGLSELVTELQQAKWTVEQKWLSRERPYSFQVTGSGNLGDVGALTKFYALTPVFSGFYRVVFLTPQAEDGTPTHRRIVFTKTSGAPNAEVHNAVGRLITQIDDVSVGGVHTIRLRPSANSPAAGGAGEGAGGDK